MAGQAGVPLANLLLYAVVAIAPTAAGWAILHVSGPAKRVLARFRPPAPVPAGPPIQRLAADLRRVHRILAETPPGTPAARRAGTRQAYDTLLAEACTAVGVEERLATIPEGTGREIERLRVEEALRGQGLRIP
ncbi:hypothetical protein [Amycolatopsis sp. CA-230715]|uniref:hypothetical protein n=1 Tax=Amycolatopsis sp. CA-230715 TaxID=2745196 RepID=UPI001C00D8E7|nr:hypothetical protein [Amycolatopsis sp. CA-230715]QWF83212.1 hypothetical protein HUW46_06652 [Amycolatopsis sp. CA-230715]